MSRLDDLPPDQRATLSLLLRRGKSYAEVAGMLDIDERAVHDRAHAALAVLAAPQARELTAPQREEVGDYLLGQRTGVAERLATRTYLDGSPQARAWATALTGELEPLAGAPLPEIPNGASPAATPATTATGVAGTPPATSPRPPRGARPRSASPARIRGALLLAAIVAAIVVAIVLLTGGGGSSSDSANSGGGGETTGSGTTSTQKPQAKEDKRITLTPADAGSKAVGVAEVLSEGNQYAFYLAAQHLAPSKGKGFFYAVWLYNSPSSYEALSRAPDVGSSGNVQGGALLPKDAAKYHTMLLTRETASKPTKPGPVILRGAFALH
ncbi:MAG TPA: sigma factor-like helix-turn-helix DNA-binding protein [Solirubrobacteraceae bacterium]|nr:sigma factor-like helix-turn-helix DNA-binding protein [Solirubrobacteraceae bacterium]